MKITVSTVILMAFFGASSATPYPNNGSADPIIVPSQGIADPSPTNGSSGPSAICYPIASGSVGPYPPIGSGSVGPYPPIGSGTPGPGTSAYGPIGSGTDSGSNGYNTIGSGAPGPGTTTYAPIGSGTDSGSNGYNTIGSGAPGPGTTTYAAPIGSGTPGSGSSGYNTIGSGAPGSPTQVPCPPGYTNVRPGDASDVAPSVPTPSGQSAQNLNAGNDKSTGGALNMGASLMGSVFGVVGAAALLI